MSAGSSDSEIVGKDAGKWIPGITWPTLPRSTPQQTDTAAGHGSQQFKAVSGRLIFTIVEFSCVISK